jgi:putative DNA methylase
MIPKECKRLAEVDFPIAVVSKHSAREKSIRHGHPSTLHLWWARRPLAACRSMLMALLLPDPCDPHCPAEFKTKASALFQQAMLPGKKPTTDAELRARLLHFIGDFADWDNAGNRTYLEIARGLVKAAHPEETPLVVDPFAGGGSIPLEALRLGCDAFASDLNPVACLINKVLLEDIPRHGPELAEELRRVGAEVKKAAERELAEIYPVDPDGARPIAYLWARTVRCEAPNCGAEIPLLRSFWLCKKAERRRALRVITTKHTKDTKRKPESIVPPSSSAAYFSCDSCVSWFEIFTPATEKEVRGGTVSRAKATCLCCGSVLPPERVRAQLAAQRGGADVVFDAKGKRTGGATLLAVVTLREGQSGRHYRLATDADYAAVWKAQQRLKQVAATKREDGLSPIPDEPLPLMSGTFNVPLYGMNTWGDLFTARQKVALVTLTHIALSEPRPPGSGAPTDPLRAVLSLVLGRCADYMSTICVWHISKELVAHTFGRQALPITWDYCETHPISEGPGNIEGALDWVAKVIEAWPAAGPLPGGRGSEAHIQQAGAAEHPLPDETAQVWFTDPPYYDAIPYSDLSDFFLVWLKRTLPGHPLLRDPFDPSNPLSPKLQEAVQDETKRVPVEQASSLLSSQHRQDACATRPKDRAWFEDTMAKAFAEGRRVLKDDGIGSVVFAHKTTEGWEALLNGLIRGGWTITGSWPISTEMATRLRARESAALATSVHLVCRPRPEDAPVGDWGQVLRELPRRVADWMQRLQAEGVRGADLVFACIGPALEVYSRYSRVVDAEEREIPLGGDPEATEPHQRGFLAYVWEVVGRAALEQVLGTAGSQAGALEEDARLTALFLWTLQTTDEGQQEPRNTPKTRKEEQEEIEEEEGDETEEEEDEKPRGKTKKGFSLPFDVVRRFAQPLGIHLDAWEGRCIETEKGIVRLIPALDRAEQLFGEAGAEAVADRLESVKSGPVQLQMFAEEEEPRNTRKTRKKTAKVIEGGEIAHRGATTLDRVHAAMLLQSSGRANALRALLKSETERSPDFLRLANALSALYPPGSDEKRLLDAMLLAVPR